jgi:hypothetical protein
MSGSLITVAARPSNGAARATSGEYSISADVVIAPIRTVSGAPSRLSRISIPRSSAMSPRSMSVRGAVCLSLR